jgi:fumarylpyruvate hydrolase
MLAATFRNAQAASMTKPADLALPAPLRPTLPIIGSDKRFPVRRIYCVGRNYVAHVREMGGDETRDFPLIFQKPVDAVVQDGGTVPYPPMTDDFHFELELMVAMKSGGYNIPQDEALSHVFGYGICLDMTRRRLLDTPDGPRIPWELKKSFDHSAPCGPVYPVEQVGHPAGGSIRLEVDGEARQDSDLSLMIWRTPEIIATLSKYYSLEPGDLIMTGTPHGVGAVLPGNTLTGSIEGLGTLTVTIGEPAVAA